MTKFLEIMCSYDAEIVGYIELTNDYQVEFFDEKTEDELYYFAQSIAYSK